MGILSSKDTRRISFDNNFAMSSSALTISKSIENENLLEYNTIVSEAPEKVILQDINKISDTVEEGDGDYWAHRIDNLKKEHQLINKIIETEYEKQIENTNREYAPPKITHERIQKIKPCYDWRSRIMKCYEENPHQPLVCATTVQAFSNCVASCRMEE